MPINPDTIGSTKPYFIMDDRACVSCGYNLRGLYTSANCPECGRPIARRRKDIPRYSDNLVHAPLPWLATFGAACTIALFAGLGLVAGEIVIGLVLAGVIVRSPLAAAPAALCAAGWWAAALVITRPRAVTRATTVDPTVEWRRLRWSARITQAFWFVTAALSALYIYNSAAGKPGVSELAIAALVSFVVAVVGLIPFLIYASNVAFWAADSSLGHSLRVCAWMIGCTALLAVLTVLDVMTQALPLGGPLRIVLFLLDYTFMLAPVGFFLYCLWGLASMGRWSVKNHVTAEARDERLRARAESAAGMDKLVPAEYPDAAAAMRLDTEEKVYAYGEIKDQPSSAGYVVKKPDHDLKPYDVDPG